MMCSEQLITSSHQPIITLPHTSPIRDGFRGIWRAPALIPAEISWRWAAGGAFWALLALSFIEYAASLKVSRGNWFLWKLGYPPLSAQTLADTIAGSGHKLLAIAAVLIPGIAIIWTFAAALGRTATLRTMMSERIVSFRTMLALNFFRAALTLAAFIGFAGVFTIAMQLYSDGPGTVPHPARSMWVLLLGWTLVAYLWTVMNWFLSVAPVIAVEQNCDALVAITETLRAFGNRVGGFFGVSVAFCALHIAAFMIFTGAALFPLMLASAVPGKVVLALLCLVTLAYFAVVDFLYLARLGAYVTLVRESLVSSR